MTNTHNATTKNQQQATKHNRHRHHHHHRQQDQHQHQHQRQRQHQHQRQPQEEEDEEEAEGFKEQGQKVVTITKAQMQATTALLGKRNIDQRLQFFHQCFLKFISTTASRELQQRKEMNKNMKNIPTYLDSNRYRHI